MSMPMRRPSSQLSAINVVCSANPMMNAVASALNFSGERNRILVSDYEFPTSAQIWHAQERRGAVVQHIPENDHGVIPVEHFERARGVAHEQVGQKRGRRLLQLVVAAVGR